MKANEIGEKTSSNGFKNQSDVEMTETKFKNVDSEIITLTEVLSPKKKRKRDKQNDEDGTDSEITCSSKETNLHLHETPKSRLRKKKKCKPKSTEESASETDETMPKKELLSKLEKSEYKTSLVKKSKKNKSCKLNGESCFNVTKSRLDFDSMQPSSSKKNKSFDLNSKGSVTDLESGLAQPLSSKKNKTSNLYDESSTNETKSKLNSDSMQPSQSKNLQTVGPSKLPKFREKDAQFQYGNYNRYYGYRNAGNEPDVRLQYMDRAWFAGKDVLDIGCNVGFVTLTIAKDFQPRKMVGLDIDESLIRVARKNVRHYLRRGSCGNTPFPLSLAVKHGPVLAKCMEDEESGPIFPNNVFFVQANYVVESDDLLELQKPEYDTILCLSVTKWVHLNWGDDGLKRLFKRMFAHLRPGGHMILEPQAWPTYSRKKKLTETIYHNYQNINFKPDQFEGYLLSKEVGFASCHVLNAPNESKGFNRFLQLFLKGAD